MKKKGRDDKDIIERMKSKSLFPSHNLWMYIGKKEEVSLSSIKEINSKKKKKKKKTYDLK